MPGQGVLLEILKGRQQQCRTEDAAHTDRLFPCSVATETAGITGRGGTGRSRRALYHTSRRLRCSCRDGINYLECEARGFAA